MTIDEIIRTAFSQPSRVTPEIEAEIGRRMRRAVGVPVGANTANPRAMAQIARIGAAAVRYGQIAELLDAEPDKSPWQIAKAHGIPRTTMARAVEWRAAQ